MVHLNTFEVYRNPEDEDNQDELVATGVEFPSGHIVMEWVRQAFPEEERTEGHVRSQYESLEDVKEATNGRLVQTS